jgi:predicted RNA-binding protein with PUA-like domain
MVDIEFVEEFPATLPLETLKHTKGLEDMVVIKKGSRLSVQPVSKTEYDIVARLGRKATSVQRMSATSTPSGGILRHKSRSRSK